MDLLAIFCSPEDTSIYVLDKENTEISFDLPKSRPSGLKRCGQGRSGPIRNGGNMESGSIIEDQLSFVKRLDVWENEAVEKIKINPKEGQGKPFRKRKTV